LGLNDVSEFNIEDRVLGLPKNNANDLVEKKLNEFVDEVSRESPAPGGGSIAALAGSLGAALNSMVSNLTSFNRGSEDVDGILSKCADECQMIKDDLLKAVDVDTQAFNDYMEARRLPRKTKEEKQIRNDAMLDGLKKAVKVPLKTAQNSFKIIEISLTVAENGNPNSITDVGVGAQMAYSGVLGGIYNVLINLKDIKDEEFCEDMRSICTTLRNEAEAKLNEVLELVESKL